MDKNEVLKKLDDFEKSLVNTTEDILSDGYDSGDIEQNNNFTKQVDNIDGINTKLAEINIDGISSSVLDEMWIRAWKDVHLEHHLPEAKNNHDIIYINLLRNFLKK